MKENEAAKILIFSIIAFFGLAFLGIFIEKACDYDEYKPQEYRT